jgi:N-acetyl-anhydromuramyl-L-alanine amidase AmpD
MRVPFIPYIQGRNDYTDSDGLKFGLAWHNTSNDASDEAEASYATRRTDGVSSHFYADGDSVTQSIDTAHKVGHAGSKQGNDNAICFEIRGANGWTRAQWLAGVDWDELAKVAAYVIRAHWPDGSFQNRRATVAEMRANPKVKAHYGHDDMRQAWGGTTHTDPGPGFPWDHLIAKVGTALGQTPQQEGTDMYCKYGDKGSLNVETLQRKLVRLGAPRKDGKPFTLADVDRSYGDDVKAGVISVVGGPGTNYGPLEVEAFEHAYAVKFGQGVPAKPLKLRFAEVVADVVETA